MSNDLKLTDLNINEDCFKDKAYPADFVKGNGCEDCENLSSHRVYEGANCIGSADACEHGYWNEGV